MATEAEAIVAVGELAFKTSERMREIDTAAAKVFRVLLEIIESLHERIVTLEQKAADDHPNSQDNGRQTTDASVGR